MSEELFFFLFSKKEVKSVSMIGEIIELIRIEDFILP
jgi:hypothetical protein